MSAKVDEIVEKLKFITLLEASELISKIEETFNVNANASIGAASVILPSATAKTEEAPVEQQMEFDVVIKEVPTVKRIAVIKVVRSLTSLGLKEAKDLIESVPKAVLEAVAKEKADEVKKLLEDAGAVVVIK